MLSTLKTIVTGKTDEKTVEVAVTEICLVKGKSVAPGDRLQLSTREADDLVAAGRAERILSDADRAKADKLRALIPPPWAAAPLPELWQNLPPVFHELWEISDKFRRMHGRANEIEILYLRRHGLTEAEKKQIDEEISGQNSDGWTRSRLLDGWMHSRTRHVGKVDLMTPDRIEELRRLADALDRSAKDIDDLRAEYGERFLKLRILAGDCVLAEVHRAALGARSAAADAREIFRVRIEALGLGQHQIERLFFGSDLHSRYVRPEPTPPSLRLGWLEQNGEPRHICDGAPDTLASWWRMFHDRADGLEKLAREASAELRKTRTAASSAA